LITYAGRISRIWQHQHGYTALPGHKYQRFSPLIAMLAIWHHVIVSFKDLGTKRVHWICNILDEMH
jgi:hypothetical protein